MANPSWSSGAWTPRFDDDFPGTTLNPVWQPGWFGATGITPPVNSTSPHNNSTYVTLPGDSTAHMKVDSSFGSILTTNPNNSASATGFQISPPAAFEARIFIPGPIGSVLVPNWVAWWATGQNWPATGEIDFLESLGVPDWNAGHIHDNATDGPNPSQPNGQGFTSNMSPNPYGWHMIGANWTASNTVQFFYDSVLVHTLATDGFTGPLYLVLNNTFNGTLDGPTTSQVDWVRVWTPGVSSSNVPGLVAPVAVQGRTGIASATPPSSVSVGGGLPATVTVTARVGLAASTLAIAAGAVAAVTATAPVGTPVALGRFYTENLCPNPSFEVDLTGYTPLVGTTLSQDITQGYSGRYSMMVVTDGSVPGEGFTGPQATVPNNGPGSMSFYLMGETGTVTVSAVSGATASIVAQSSVTLQGGDYQRVVLSGLALSAGQQMYVLVQTTTAQALTFWIDAVQYEMDATPHPYIDGDSPQCQWEGTPGESASFQTFQFATGASGGMFLEGIASPVAQGAVFLTSASGNMTLSGTESGTISASPVGALSDFGIWTAADMDPAVSYIELSNAGQATGQTGWNRVYALAYPPQQAVGSNGQVIWPRAAFAALGFTFKAVTNTWQQSLADVQFERMPVVPGATPAPSAYQPPRQISTIIKPSRLNFCPNPSIEVSTAGWTAIGAAGLSRDATVSVDGHSLKVTLHASADGAYIAIPNLIVGDTYVVSAQVQGGPGLEDIIMACSGASVTSPDTGVPYGGSTILGVGYGQGPYGGVGAATSDMPTAQWFTATTVFTALQSTVSLSFKFLPGSDVSYPTQFWVDQVLVEEGDLIQPYFDGGSGTDYSWETGGTSGLARSYYYQRQNVAAGAVTGALAEHTPLGILAATPQYSVPPSQ